jgi:hypothetical protein
MSLLYTIELNHSFTYSYLCLQIWIFSLFSYNVVINIIGCDCWLSWDTYLIMTYTHTHTHTHTHIYKMVCRILHSQFSCQRFTFFLLILWIYHSITFWLPLLLMSQWLMVVLFSIWWSVCFLLRLSIVWLWHV